MEQLQGFTTLELKEQWRHYFKIHPPSSASRDFIISHICWHMQAKQHGGLSRKASGQIRKLVQQLKEGKDLTPATELTIKPGTRLIRAYKGTKHEVFVEEGVYRYQDQTYRSLSQIARNITGTRWNGRLFFGVKS